MTIAKPYDAFMVALFQGVHDFSQPYGVALLTSAYTPDYGNHQSAADLAGELSTVGTGYSGAVTLENVVLPGAVNQMVTMTADNLIWASLTATFRYAAVYRQGDSPANSPLVGLIDFETDQSLSGEQFELAFPYGVISLLGS